MNEPEQKSPLQEGLEDPQSITPELHNYIDSYAANAFSAESLDRMEAAYNKATAAGKSEQPKQQREPSDREELDMITYMQLLQFRIDALKDPEAALIKYAPEAVRAELLSDMQASRFARFVNEVAAKTGADPEQIANKETRTQEQQALLNQAAVQSQITRMEQLAKSLYLQAVALLSFDAISSATYNQDEQNTKKIADSLEYFIADSSATYFFAQHRSIDPLSSGTLTQEQQEDLKTIYAKLCSYFNSRIREDGKPETKHATLEIFLDYVRGEYPEEQTSDDLPRIQYKKTADIKTVTDKLANVFFSLAAPTPGGAINGQRQMTQLKYEGRKSKKEVTLFYDYAWNEETLRKYGLDKKFEDFDFFVMSVCDNLFAAGNDTVSLAKIYTEMGGIGKPAAKQLEPIYYSLLKGQSTITTIDDYDVLKAWGKAPDGKYHEIISPVMPVILGNERFIANGKIANGYVKITALSPFRRVAEPLGHITAWEKDVLRLYSGRKTKRYYSVLRFLMMQIGWMRNGNRSTKILYSSLYNHTGDTSTRGQQLARDMMYRLLDEVFIPAEYVKAYKEDAEPAPGVLLTLHKKRLQIKGK